jgi:hypothetical protein
MLVLALQFSRATSDLLPGDPVDAGRSRWSRGLAVIAGTAMRYRRQVRALPVRGLLPQNGTVTSSSSGFRWCLLVQPKLKAGVGRIRCAN